ncbi:MAG: penicillin-binding transpeptidase domain-containing protein [Ilumatobacteraceae bacterium]
MAVDKRAARLGALALVSVILLGLVGTRLWFLQTVQRQSVVDSVSRSKTRTQVLLPERGRIFDVYGRILADNRRVLTVTVDRAVIRRESQRLALFTRLSGIVGVPVEEMQARYKSGRYSQYLPLPIAEDMPEDVVLRLESRSEDFPGVRGDEDWERVYPYAPLASHVIGYLGLILMNQAAEYDAKGYLNNETVGQFGVEKSMEDVLHGDWGQVVYEVDSANRVVREISRREPTPGKDVRLTIDLTVQQYTEQILQTRLAEIRTQTDPKGGLMAKNAKWKDPLNPSAGFVWKFTAADLPEGQSFTDYQNPKSGSLEQYVPYLAPGGSVVVQNHSDGQIVAMASYPTFDNRWFTVGLSGEKFKVLFPETKNPDKSILVNRAIQGQYNLGSTFKPIVAYSALATGIIDPGYTFSDNGSYVLNIDKKKCSEGVRCEYFNALGPFGTPSEYGQVNVTDALAVSSDAFFYRIGEKMFEATDDRQLLADEVRLFGFGADTGIDLPYEFDGRVPSSELKAQLIAKKVLEKGENPKMLVGDNVQLAIGQGLLAATPLQLAGAYSTIANGGFVYRPHIIASIYRSGTPDDSLTAGVVDLSKAVLLTDFSTPELVRQLDMPGSIRDAIVEGLRRVITGPGVEYPAGRYHATTGEYLFDNYDSIPIAGKTGTAQGSKSKPWFDSSVFAAFSVDEASPYTVVSYMEKAGYGSKASGTVVKCVFEMLGGQVAAGPVALSDPLDQTNLVPSLPNLTEDTACTFNRYTDTIRD